MTHLLLLLFFSCVQLTTGQFYCADLIQQCAKSAAEYTEQILQYKESAFKSCVRRPACHTERKIFDECFDASVSATHISPPQESTSNDGETRKVTQPPMVKYNSLLKFFTEKSMNFRSALDQCFVRSPFVPKRNFFGPSILDEDAAYARAIYQFDLADRLWGLPELSVTRPSLDTLGVCRTQNTALRVFGSGISRIARASDPKKNNLTSSCMLDEDEITCYRQALDLNSEYIQLIYNRDYALRACIQNLRQQSVCRMNDKSRLRSCLCGVREQYDNDVQAGILQCVKSKSPHIPAMVIEMSSSLDEEPTSAKIQEQVTPAQLTFDTPGAIVNGQCMCACEHSAKNEATRLFANKKNNNDVEKSTQIEKKPEKQGPEIQEEVVEMETVKDEQPPKTSAVRFKENSPRLMQPSEAAGRVFWMNNITIT
ncbi:Protein upregulated in glial subsets pugs-5 [Caenorhabditis elegans]|uniref:Protein upregulated in glial subsets pugs-5 n=1 Tax=Caenorhabditis elegans TaxID=6239 RepID=YRN8_CAEEL|nr:Uncharacterized protein CELE_R07B1.8 [Caenorhabditis elegans]Q09608.2 RecName: Full=Uncharacterized protein R07B1.8 [Caenorhabditis elegans]CAA88545.2 Uncharacterized protein CELE_R07B1.8 [Caenorhabditis elegans]|eukprot:NP_509656.2 Uncharacterized protein CELE_R07B1.8 [Caenorhabditis elegans]